MWQSLKVWIRGTVRSWTMWFNSTALAIIGLAPIIEAELPALQAYLPPTLYRYVTLGVLVANLLLRAKTARALSER